SAPFCCRLRIDPPHSCLSPERDMPMHRPALSAALLLWLALAATGEPQPARRAAGTPKQATPTDDPLPKWALSRFGNNRWLHPAQQLAFSPDGRYLAVTGQVTRLFDVTTGRGVRRFHRAASYLCFTPDGKTLITTPYGFTPTLSFWDVATGKRLR